MPAHVQAVRTGCLQVVAANVGHVRASLPDSVVRVRKGQPMPWSMDAGPAQTVAYTHHVLTVKMP